MQGSSTCQANLCITGPRAWIPRHPILWMPVDKLEGRGRRRAARPRAAWCPLCRADDVVHEARDRVEAHHFGSAGDEVRGGVDVVVVDVPVGPRDQVPDRLRRWRSRPLPIPRREALMRYNRISAKERMPCVADGPDGPRWVAQERSHLRPGRRRRRLRNEVRAGQAAPRGRDGGDDQERSN